MDVSAIIRSGLFCHPNIAHPVTVMCDLPPAVGTVKEALAKRKRPFWPADTTIDAYRSPRPMTVSLPHSDYYGGVPFANAPFGRQNGTEHYADQFLLHEQSRWHVPMTVCQHRRQLALSTGEGRYNPQSCALSGQRLQVLTKTGHISSIAYDRSVYKN